MIEVELPDGSIAEFPDGTSDDVIKGALQKRFGSPSSQAAPETSAAPETPSALADIVPSFAAGAARGAADLAGLPGTLSDVGQGALQWGLRNGYQLATGAAPDPNSESAVERFFAGPSQEAQDALLFGGKNPLSGDMLKSGMSAVTDGATDYQPYTTAGKYARTVGEFLPGGTAFGANKIAGVLAPALASETAGQLTEDTWLEPYARVVGALLGGYAGSKFAAPKAEKLATAAEIKKSAGYGDEMTDILRNAKTTEGTYGKIVGDLWDDLKQAGTSYEVQQNFGRTMQNEMKLVHQEGASLHSLERLRRALRSAGGGKLDTPNQAIANRLIDKLDTAVENLSSSSIKTSGDTGRPVLDWLKEAREVYRTGKKAELIEKAVSNAQNVASGVENGLRNEFRKLLKPEQAKNFTKTELDAIQDVVKGNFTSNALRFLGTFGFPIDQGRNWLGAAMGSSAAGSMAGSYLGPGIGTAVGAGVALGGTAAKYGATRATKGLADIAEALVKAGPQTQGAYSAGQAARQVAGKEALIRALLQSQSAVQAPSARKYAR